MKHYALILKVLFRQQFRFGRLNRDENKLNNKLSKSNSRISGYKIAVYVSIIPLLALFAFFGYVSGELSLNTGISASMLTSLITTTQFITLFFGAAALMSTMFFSGDNEFLLSLPTKPLSTYFAKLTIVYLNELTVTAFCLLPMLIAFGLGYGVTGAAAALYYCMIIPVVLLAPVLPLLIVSLLSIPLMYVISYLKKRSAMTSIVVLLVSLVAMGVYFALFSSISSVISEDGQLSASAIKAISGFGNAIYPYKCAANLMLNIKAAENFGIFAAIIVAAFVLTSVSTLVFYRRAVASQLENEKHVSKKGIKTESHSIVSSLMIKDFKNLLRSPTLAINSFMNIFMAPLLLVIFGLFTNGFLPDEVMDVEGASYNGQLISMGMILMYSIMLSCSMNYIALLSFTREGKCFYINRYLPLKKEDILRSKQLFADIDSFLAILLVAIVATAVLKIDIVQILLMVGNLILFAIGFNAWGIYRDMKKPNFTWTNINEAIKRNTYVAVPMFLGIGIGILAIIISSTIAATATILSDLAQYAIFWSVMYAIAIVFAILMTIRLNKNADELFYKMGNN